MVEVQRRRHRHCLSRHVPVWRRESRHPAIADHHRDLVCEQRHVRRSIAGRIQGLKYWANGVNKTGGVFVKAFDKKIPVKIVAYDDQSSTSTATTLYNQLITQNHVD